MSDAVSSIDHAHVERHDIVARYRARQLAPEEEEAFEIHYLDCETCRAALEEHEALTAGFRAAAEEGLVSVPRSAPRWLPPYAIAASLLAIVLAALLLRGTEPLPTAAPSAQIVPLLTVRDGAPPADVTVTLSPDPELIVFVIDAAPAETARYDVSVADAANRVLWSAGDLPARPTLGASRLTVAIPSSSLAEGRLRLTVAARTAEGAAAGQPRTYTLLVSASR